VWRGALVVAISVEGGGRQATHDEQIHVEHEKPNPKTVAKR
jgi:hypothetical protein